MNQKYVVLGITLMFILIATTTNVVQASSFGELGRDIGNSLAELGDDLDKASSSYSEGKDDGERAGVNGESSKCPSDDTAYCVGWNSGYYKGSESVKTVNANQNQDDDDN